MGNDRKKPAGNQRLAAEHLTKNAILRDLRGDAQAAVLDRGELLNLKVRQRIYEPEHPISEVYFPLDAIISIVAHMRDGTMIEVGTIGCEGVSAIPLLMGATATANANFCQVPGAAVRIPVNVFRELMRTTAPFRQLLDRYLQAYVNMLGQLAACNRLHTVYERCARWLLMSQDRVEGDTITLTHEYLAMMLGTNRSGVTIAASTLQHAGFISYARGKITIRDRIGLEGATCECYAVASEQFGGLLRPVNGARRA